MRQKSQYIYFLQKGLGCVAKAAHVTIYANFNTNNLYIPNYLLTHTHTHTHTHNLTYTLLITRRAHARA